MPEEKKSIRLKKAATEFNVGIATIIEFLNKKGISIENNPNIKLDSDLYNLLSSEFQSERQKKDKADSLQISINKKSETPEPEKEPKSTDYDTQTSNDNNDIIIKTNTLDFVPEQTPDKQEKSSENKTKSPIIDSDSSEVITLGSQQINILGKIDLNSLNTKTKPDKKKKENRKEEKTTDNSKKKDKRKTTETSKKKDTAPVNKETSTEQQATSSPKSNKLTEHAPVKHDKEKSNNDNFIQTNYIKLSGPVITGEKVDLTIFNSNSEKKKNSSAVSKEKDEKKKRNRIKTASAIPINKDTKNIQEQQNDISKKDNKKKDKRKDKRKHTEIDNTEIEKQIKETLARLSPMGKSKTSKHRREKRHEVAEQHQLELLEAQEQKNILKVTEFVTANELATMMNVPVTKIIASCMQLGMFVSINQRLDAEALQLIADEFGYKIEFVSAEVVNALETEEEQDREE
ncbi:translation initiation factor IF-2 N-terminal domain-containing protein, partial [bacterium]|nr:translation initiation factor IF-2 N-terminal domain-containing protein [bacterium]